MRRTYRLFVAGTLLLMFLGSASLFVRSFWISDQVWASTAVPDTPALRHWTARCDSGRVFLARMEGTDFNLPKPGLYRWTDSAHGGTNITDRPMKGDEKLWNSAGFSFYSRPAWRRQLYTTTAVLIPRWVIVAGLGFSLLLAIWIARPCLKPPAAGLCRKCGYDLRATPDRCPECGTIVTVDFPAASK